MKPFISLLLCLYCSAVLFGQNTLEGKVYLYKEKGINIPLADVYIKATYGGSVITTSTGDYNLSFDNSSSIITLTARKNGYEVINEEELQTLDLTKKKQQNIYLDIEGNTELRKRQLLDAALNQAKKLRDAYYITLDKGGSQAENLKRKLEDESGEKFANLDEVRTYIYKKYGADIKTLQSLVPAIITQNLDHTNKEVEQIKRYTLNGQLDSALLLLNFEQSKQKIDLNNIRINTFREENNKEGEKYLSAIPLLLNSRLFGKVDSSYQLYVRSDTLDYDRYYKYAFFLQNQNRLKESDSVYEILLKKLPDYDFQLKASILNNQGFIQGVFKSYDSSLLKFKESLLIREKLSEISPDGYLSGYAQTATNIGVLEENMGMHDSAISYLKKALEKFQLLANKQPDIYLEYMAGVYNNLATVNFTLQNFDDALYNYNKAVNIYQQLMSNGKEKWYRAGIASSYNSLSVLYQYMNQFKEAGIVAQYSLNFYQDLSEENPDMYKPYLEGVLNNIANLKKNIGQYDSAKIYYDQCISVVSDLAEKNPQVYKVAFADVLNNYALLLGSLNQNTEAEKKYKQAIEIYTDEACLYNNTNGLNKSLNNLATLLKEQYRIEELKIELEKVQKKLYPVAKTNTSAAFDFTIKLNNNLCKLAIDGGNINEVIKYTLYNIELCEKIVLQNHVAEYERDLVENYETAADNYFKIDNLQLANLYYNKALKMYRVLITQDFKLYDSGFRSNIIAWLNLSKRINNTNEEKEEFLESLKVSLVSQKQRKKSFKNYENIVTVSSYIAKVYTTFCEKDSAYKYYTSSLIYSDSLITSVHEKINEGMDKISSKIYCIYNGNASWYALNARNYALGQKFALKALEADTSQHWVETNLAHALLLSGKYNKARRIYIRLKNSPYEQDNNKTYLQVILDDFQNLECSGAISPERESDVQRIKEILTKQE